MPPNSISFWKSNTDKYFVNPIIKSWQFYSPWCYVSLSTLGKVGLLDEHGDDVLLAALQLGVELDPRLIGRLSGSSKGFFTCGEADRSSGDEFFFLLS